MTIQQLQYLLEVSRTGSITKAAKNLYVAQSSVSNAISALEDELGFQIFSRTWQGVEPTKEGQRILTHAVHILEHHRQMTEEDGLSIKNLHIESSTYPLFYEAFLRTVEHYRSQSSLTFSHYVCLGRRNALNRLSTLESDLLLTTVLHFGERAFAYDVTTRGLAWQSIKQLPAVIRIGPGHRLYDKPEITIEDLRDDYIIEFFSDDRTRKLSELRSFIGFDFRRILASNDRTARYEMAARGLGYLVGAALPEGVIDQYRFRSIPIPGLRYHIVAVTNPAQPVRPEIQYCLDCLQEKLAEI